jgi:hypothetical protein
VPGTELDRHSADIEQALTGIMGFGLNCKETSRLLSQAQDQRLPVLERLRLRLHLGVCDACTQFARQLEFLRTAMHAYPGPDMTGPEAPPEEKNTR